MAFVSAAAADEDQYDKFRAELSPEGRAYWRMYGTLDMWELAADRPLLGLVEQLIQLAALVHLYAYLYTAPGSDFVSAQTYHHVQMNVVAIFIFVARVIVLVQKSRLPIPVALWLKGSMQLEQLFGEARTANGPNTGFTLLDLVHRLQKAFTAAAYKASEPKYNARDRRRGTVFTARLRDLNDVERKAITIHPDEWDAEKLSDIWDKGMARSVLLIEGCRPLWNDDEYRDPKLFFNFIASKSHLGYCLARPRGLWIGVRPIDDPRSLLRKYAIDQLKPGERDAFVDSILPGVDTSLKYEDYKDDSDDSDGDDGAKIIDGDAAAAIGPGDGEGFSSSSSEDEASPAGGAGDRRLPKVKMLVNGIEMYKATALRLRLGGVVAGLEGVKSRAARYKNLDVEPVVPVAAAEGALLACHDYVLFPAQFLGGGVDRPPTYFCAVGEVDYILSLKSGADKPVQLLAVSEERLQAEGRDIEVHLHTVCLRAMERAPDSVLFIERAEAGLVKQLCVAGAHVTRLRVTRTILGGATTAIEVDPQSLTEAMAIAGEEAATGRYGKPTQWPVVKAGLFVSE